MKKADFKIVLRVGALFCAALMLLPGLFACAPAGTADESGTDAPAAQTADTVDAGKDAETGGETLTDAGTVTEPEPDTEAEPDTETQTDAETETDTETDTETETETEPETDGCGFLCENMGGDFLYLCKWTGDGSDFSPTGGATTAARFSVPEGEYLDTFNVIVKSRSGRASSMTFTLYKWAGDYATTVAGNCLGQQFPTLPESGTRLTVRFAQKAYPAGEYLLVMEDAPSKGGVYMRPKAGSASVVSYINGEEADTVAQSYVTFSSFDAGVEANPDGYVKFTPGKAHVILLSGQSNASGISVVNYLKKTSEPGDFARYERGYDNVLISYAVDMLRSESGFVPVKPGQGRQEDTFGPEVGIADYLSAAYPDETFYIIKCSVSAAGIAQHFQNENGEYGYFITGVLDRLKKMSKDGLDPEIIAFCWMQGETDAMTYDYAVRYEALQADFVGRVTTRVKNGLGENGMAFIDAEISGYGGWTHNETVNVQKRRWAAADQNRYCVAASDLMTDKENNDPCHYDSQDMITLGHRFGQAIGLVIERGRD